MSSWLILRDIVKQMDKKLVYILHLSRIGGKIPRPISTVIQDISVKMLICMLTVKLRIWLPVGWLWILHIRQLKNVSVKQQSDLNDWDMNTLKLIS